MAFPFFPPKSPPSPPKEIRLQGPQFYDKEPYNRKEGLIIQTSVREYTQLY